MTEPQEPQEPQELQEQEPQEIHPDPLAEEQDVPPNPEPEGGADVAHEPWAEGETPPQEEKEESNGA